MHLLIIDILIFLKKVFDNIIFLFNIILAWRNRLGGGQKHRFISFDTIRHQQNSSLVGISAYWPVGKVTYRIEYFLLLVFILPSLYIYTASFLQMAKLDYTIYFNGVTDGGVFTDYLWWAISLNDRSKWTCHLFFVMRLR